MKKKISDDQFFALAERAWDILDWIDAKLTEIEERLDNLCES